MASSMYSSSSTAPFEDYAITVLLVDDQEMVAEALKQMLKTEKDIDFHFCKDPSKALQVAAEIKPTVILQDLIMPKIDGLTMVKFFRANPITKDVPMMVLSSREEADVKYKAFALGANDYIVKLPDKLEVVARIRYHSKAYINLLERNKAYEALLASQSALKAELDEAERYVKSLLPKRISSSTLTTDWIFKSSTILGGDAFGYHWIDETHFAIYLLDVCGHGVGAALLSVSAINVLRTQSLAVNFIDPAAVLSAMNDSFDMSKQNQMYFTFWYGVYNKDTQELHYSSGGHPPAMRITKEKKIIPLRTEGMVIGGMPGVSFSSKSVTLDPNDQLFVFSDGVYEIFYKDDPSKMMTLDEFASELTSSPKKNLSKVESMVAYCQDIQGHENFEDDFSLLEINFA